MNLDRRRAIGGTRAGVVAVWREARRPRPLRPAHPLRYIFCIFTSRRCADATQSRSKYSHWHESTHTEIRDYRHGVGCLLHRRAECPGRRNGASLILSGCVHMLLRRVRVRDSQNRSLSRHRPHQRLAGRQALLVGRCRPARLGVFKAKLANRGKEPKKFGDFYWERLSIPLT